MNNSFFESLFINKSIHADFGNGQDPWGKYNLHLNSLNGLINNIIINKVGAFSNALIQISSAINCAITLDVENIVIQGEYLCKDTHPIYNNDPIWFIKNAMYEYLPGKFLITSNDHKVEGTTLSGDFFDIAMGNGLRNLLFKDKNFNMNSFKLIKDNLNLNFNKYYFNRDFLTIYIRSGDVFTSQLAPGYGQPPLVFYKKIIQSKNWGHILIVYEDLGNPVIAPLQDYCLEKNISFDIFTGDLKDTIEILLNAKNLVLARGTFSTIIASMNEKLINVYDFHGTSGFIPISCESKISAYDISGDYIQRIMNGNWMNSIEQRELMITYDSVVLK